jgi:hypothetical protein
MPTPSTAKWPRPKSEDEWEDMVLDAMRLVWNDPNAQRNGRRGQRQYGVDVFGLADGRQVGAQAKNMDKLSETEAKDEIKKAEDFVPKIRELYFAVAGPRDAAFQQTVRLLSVDRVARAAFPVHVLFYDDICQKLASQQDLVAKYWRSFLSLSNLEDAQRFEYERRIGEISQSSLQREQYLKQLNKLIDRPPNELGHMDKLYIRQISEFNGRLIDAAIPILLSSSTLEEFLNGLGFELRSDMNRDEFLRIIMSQELPDGSPFQPALICNVSGETNLVVTDRLVWTCSSGMELLNAEYSYARNI